MAEKSKKKSGKADQIAKLELEVGEDGMAQAKKLAETIPSIVALAFKYRASPQAAGLTKKQRDVYFQLKAIKGGEANAETWRNDRLIERKLDPKVVGPEPAEEKVSAK